MSVITDENILADLEYRGISAFLAEMESGIKIPSCFVTRVQAILEEVYGCKFTATTIPTNIKSGTFCMMPYWDETTSRLTKITRY